MSATTPHTHGATVCTLFNLMILDETQNYRITIPTGTRQPQSRGVNDNAAVISYLRWVRNDGDFTDCETDDDCKDVVGEGVAKNLKCGILFGHTLDGSSTEEVKVNGGDIAVIHALDGHNSLPAVIMTWGSFVFVRLVSIDSRYTGFHRDGVGTREAHANGKRRSFTRKRDAWKGLVY